jgi:hypothetical protein
VGKGFSDCGGMLANDEVREITIMPWKDPEKRRAYGRKWARNARATRPELRERQRLRSRAAYHKRRQDPEWRRRWNAESNERNYKRKYGMTRTEKFRLLASQGGMCAVCGTDAPTAYRPWHLDHCHKTKRIRGVLCHHCNVALGALRDDPDIAEKAATYLRRFQ